MTFSAYLLFLKDYNILIGIPKTMKEKYRKIGENLTKKKSNISEIKTYSLKYKGSDPSQKLLLSEKEKHYKLKISQRVNAKNSDFGE